MEPWILTGRLGGWNPIPAHYNTAPDMVGATR